MMLRSINSAYLITTALFVKHQKLKGNALIVVHKQSKMNLTVYTEKVNSQTYRELKNLFLGTKGYNAKRSKET